MSLLPRSAPERARRVDLPRPPEATQPHGFPVLATVAPVLASLALWAITSSPFALVFAALGPVIAVASVGDARIVDRRTRKRERKRYLLECTSALEAIRLAHGGERDDLARLAPAARDLLENAGHDPEQWRATPGSPIAVRLGEGTVASALELQGVGSASLSGELARRLGEVRSDAASVANAPVIVDATLGIGFCGPRALALSAARAIVVQLAAKLSPAHTQVAVAGMGNSWEWLDTLPHGRSERPATWGAGRSRAGASGAVPSEVHSAVPSEEQSAVRGEVPVEVLVPGAPADAALVSCAPAAAAASGPEIVAFISENATSPPVVVAVADSPEHLPRETRIVVMVGAGDSVVLRHPQHPRIGTVRIDFVARAEASVWAHHAGERARAEGVAPRTSALPAAVALATVLRFGTESNGRPRAGLGAPIGFGESGIVAVDLVRDGPHAIVGGTTGSGKSELLVSWVLSMADQRAPEVVSFLFVDFKGGAAFDPLRALPHCVGVITDLDAHEALRALVSLRAELRQRERILAASKLRSIDEAPPGTTFPRLVIVVDEYAAMVDEHPDLSALFTDLAARGRSLGVHLVLCTQRPSGVVKDGILANCGLRLSLRVNNRADSAAVVGTDAAAALPASPVGRALVASSGAPPLAFQVAHAAPADIAAVARRWDGSVRPRRPWCAPLRPVITFGELGEAGVQGSEESRADLPFALADLPREQRQDLARYDPARHGHLLVVGGAGSGKSGVLAALGAAPSTLRTEAVPPGLAAVWDVLSEVLSVVLSDVRSDVDGPIQRILLIDDIDATLASTPDDYAGPLLDLLTRTLREGPATGVHVVITAQRLTGALQSASALCGSSLVLRMPNRQEHLLAGGEPEDWTAGLPAGGGFWEGSRVQTLSVERPARQPWRPRARAVDLGCSTPLLVVSSRPGAFAEQLRRARPARAVVEIGETTGDPRHLLVTRGGTSDTIVGDPEAWQSHWGALGALRGAADVLFDGVSTGDVRALTGVRELPPPAGREARALWLLSRDGRLSRATLDTFAD